MQIDRCPRPKSDKWPKVGQQAERPGNSKRSQSAAGWLMKQQQKSVWDVASRPPDRGSAEATEEVRRLEAALSALGEGNPHAKPLVEALRVARAKAKVLPLEEQIIACKNFVERARKRVTRVEAVISRALEQKVVFETEVQEGEARLQQLEDSHSHRTTAPWMQPRQSQSEGGQSESAPGVWMADGPPVVESIPPIPMSSVQDIEGWLSIRNCELRNALEFGDSATVAGLWWHRGQLNWQVLCRE